MLLVGFCCVGVSATVRSGLGVLFAEEVSFGGLEQRAFVVGGGEGDAAVDHGVADFDDLAVESPFGVVGPGCEGFCLAEAGTNASGAFPGWFEVGGNRPTDWSGAWVATADVEAEPAPSGAMLR